MPSLGKPLRLSIRAALVTVAWSALAGAQPDPGTMKEVRLTYAAPTDCPDGSDFAARLLARSANVRVAHDESAPELIIRVTHHPAASPHAGHEDAAHGDLSIRYVDGSQAKRALDGDTCESVVDALALMSAMAIDPTGVALASRPPPPPVKAAAPALPVLSPPADLLIGTHVAFGAGGGVVFGTAPIPTPDFTAFVEVTRQNGTLGSPGLRASFDYASSPAATVPGGEMQAVRIVGALEGCPLEWSSGPFRLLPCARVEAGTLSARGLLVVPSRSASRPWAAGGLLARSRYFLLPRFFVEVSAALLAPFVRDRFFFEPGTTVFRPPVVTGSAAAALGLTIP